jgi:hypothetical protein
MWGRTISFFGIVLIALFLTLIVGAQIPGASQLVTIMVFVFFLLMFLLVVPRIFRR